MVSASSTPNNAPTAAVCSGKNCNRTLSSGPFKGNLCDRCTTKMRSRRSVSNKADMHVDALPEVSGEKKRRRNTAGGSLPLAGPCDLPLNIPTQTDDSVSNFAKTRHPQPKRSSFAIPYQTLTALDSSSVIAANSNDLPAYHFNSRGEIINFTQYGVRAEGPHIARNIEQFNRDQQSEMKPKCSRCHCSMPGYFLGDMCPNCRVDVSIMSRTTDLTNVITPVSVQPMIPTSVHATCNATPNTGKTSFTDIQNNMDEDGDMDIDNLELTYPASPNMDQVEALEAEKLDTHIEHMLPEAGSSSRTPDQPGPSKRLKASHPEIIDISRPSTHPQPRNVVEPLGIPNLKGTKSTSFRSLKLCATANCTGIISADSFATRCLSCVRNDWKSKRSKLSEPTKQIHTATTSKGILKGQDQVSPEWRKKLKAVTWADEISDALVDDLKNNEPANSASDQFTKLEPRTFLPNSPTNSSQKRSASKIRLIVNLPPSDLIRDYLPSKGRHADSVSSPLRLDSNQSIPSNLSKEEITGWDSDLTELSDIAEDADSTYGSTSESEVNVGSPSISIGLKIRIPPRPDGAYTRNCASPRCNQVLSTKYRWKSCVMCRAQSRDYQRRRQNIQGRHTRLDRELFEAQNMGTPLSGDLHKQDREMEEDPVKLVPGARLCSIRNCTYIIPPVEEYHWKMCALCRLRRREKKRQDRLNESTKSSAGQMATVSIQKTINNLPLRRGPRPAGRCQSLDCGMMICDSKSYQCKQCISRRNWLMNRSGGSPNARGFMRRRQYIEKPQKPSPYPHFRCFSALLLEFKNRLAGFLQAQSIFFLFKQMKDANALFAFDGEFSIVALDFDLIKRKDEVDSQAMKYRREIEHVGRIKFNPKRLVSILEGGGIAVRFVTVYPVPVLQATVCDNKTVINTVSKDMQCELEIASVPDDSHQFIPGQRTIIRFRLLG